MSLRSAIVSLWAAMAVCAVFAPVSRAGEPDAAEIPEAATDSGVDETDRALRRDRAEATLLRVGDEVAVLDPRGAVGEHHAALARTKLAMARKLLDRGQVDAAQHMANEAGASAEQARGKGKPKTKEKARR